MVSESPGPTYITQLNEYLVELYFIVIKRLGRAQGELQESIKRVKFSPNSLSLAKTSKE